MKLVSWVFAIKHLCEMPGNFKEIKFLGEQSMPYSSDTLLWLQKPFFFPEEIVELYSLSKVFILKLIFLLWHLRRERETSKYNRIQVLDWLKSCATNAEVAPHNLPAWL